ncbi:MAG TPA: DEAD/DEAH box helicase [Flavobacteriaceae bacterium]|jgi:ATP-dependent RNA helicase DeaD|nr:ATP-dependent RNA helicase [Flavobacteriaceae bacterium]HIB48260.1 DEAD/DEAH box helicase [Flavobacteriaceae bacterium]HIN97705.1 DEAD/DEAH box helicase [Flavobacteriaceae bacterium]|tara:strand:- start:157337 stop:159184 length:1848 start_codon:yes stop_codon:yes gene_type:complete
MSKFQELGLGENFLKAITDMGFENPSEVQEKAIPILLEKDTDLVALAQTGTGKTAAFGFPMLQQIDVESRTTQGLILSPTRELCMQITNEMNNYGKYLKGLNVVAIYGGASITEQAKQIKRGAQVIVATPGRMKDMIGRRMIDISKIEYCVLDEADEMLNMGFYEDITEILSHSPEDKSTWLFSATMPKEVASIAKKFMHNPIEITVGSKNVGAANVSHEYYMVNARDRYQALKRLADANPDIFSVVFCRTKRDTQKVAEQLIADGYNAGAIHGDLSQNQRDIVMKQFRTRQIQMMVATDVAARGIDVDDITHVINYQLPDEIETYTHRSGRTGRAGKEGISMVIVSKSEARKIKQIEKIIQQKFQKKEIPSGMEICEKQLMHLANNIKETEINHDIDVYLPQIDEALKDFSKEELIKKFFSVEFTRFYNYYQKAKDLNVIAGDPSTSENKDSVRFFLNVGSRDDFNWMSLKDFLKDLLSLGQDEVYKVDVKDNFSFFNVDTKHKELVEGIFTDFQMDGRNVNVEISTDTGRGGGGRKGGRGGRSGRDSRSFKGKDRGRRGDDKRGRRGDDRKSKGGGFKKSGDSGDEFKSKFSGKRRGKSKPESKGTGGKRRRG